MARNLGCAQTLFQPGSSRGCHQQHGMYLPYRCHVSTTKVICHAQTRFAGNLPSIPVRWEAGATGLTAVEAQVEVDGGRRFAVVPLADNTQRPDEVRLPAATARQARKDAIDRPRALGQRLVAACRLAAPLVRARVRAVAKGRKHREPCPGRGESGDCCISVLSLCYRRRWSGGQEGRRDESVDAIR